MTDDLEKKNKDLEEKVTKLKKEIRSLQRDLIHDHLTDLRTRAFFEEELSVYLDAINAKNDNRRREWFGFTKIGVIFFDIDHFKQINDTYGHDVGDEVLKKVAKTINNSLRDGDTAARWGGEEIAVFLLGASEKNTRVKAEKIRQRIESLSFSNSDLHVTISGGVAFVEDGVSFEEVIKRADKALYTAKEGGRNKIVSFSEL